MQWRTIFFIFGLSLAAKSQAEPLPKSQLVYEHIVWQASLRRLPQPLNSSKDTSVTLQGQALEKADLDPTKTYFPYNGAPRFPNTVPSSDPMPTETRPTQQNSLENFSTRLFCILSAANTKQNLVYSPISLQTMLALVYIGSEGNTAKELQTGLQLSADKGEVLQMFQDLMKALSKSNGGAQLIMANKIYYNSNLYVNPTMQNLGREVFDAEVEAAPFAMPARAAQAMNQWVTAKTQSRIKNIIDPQMVDSNTAAVLLNAIYFKAKWSKPFSVSDTEKQNFYTSPQRAVPVDMMFVDDTFRYGEFSDLQAKVVELPYLNSELSMLIILPSETNGLAAVEDRLRNVDLRSIADRLAVKPVTVRLPKFRVEFDADMLYPLQALGIRQVFTDAAQLTGFFCGNSPVGISQVAHKAFIDVNEAGSEAAGLSFAKLIPLTLPPKTKTFTVDHPFVFAIRGPSVVYFVGHVVNF